MTLDKIGWICGEFTTLDKFSEQFTTLINFAQGQYFTQNIEDEDKTFPFVNHMGVDNGTMPMIVSSGGIANIPSDFVMHKVATFLINGKQEQIEDLEQWEFAHRISQHIEIPTRQYPILCHFGDKIKFLPKNLQYVNYTYLAKPPDAVYATKQENGLLVYDPANSVELLWREQDQIEIIRILLQELGIIVSAEQVKSKINPPQNQ